jgi:hypothetical protein
MNLLSLLTNHTHYWGVPHERSADRRIVQTCYGCCKDRDLKVELRSSRAPIEPKGIAPEIGVLKHAMSG